MSDDLKEIRGFLSGITLQSKYSTDVEMFILEYVHRNRCLKSRIESQKAAINKLHADLKRERQINDR